MDLYPYSPHLLSSLSEIHHRGGCTFLKGINKLYLHAYHKTNVLVKSVYYVTECNPFFKLVVFSFLRQRSSLLASDFKALS
jgi:hypothetical protein